MLYTIVSKFSKDDDVADNTVNIDKIIKPDDEKK